MKKQGIKLCFSFIKNTAQLQEIILPTLFLGFPGGSVVKNPPVNAGAAEDEGLIPELWRTPEGGNGNPLQYSCLENPMDRRA